MSTACSHLGLVSPQMMSGSEADYNLADLLKSQHDPTRCDYCKEPIWGDTMWLQDLRLCADCFCELALNDK